MRPPFPGASRAGRAIRVENASREVLLGSRVTVADRWWTRARGLLGAPPLEPGQGLMLTPCRAVHLLGMRLPLDVVFLDAQWSVVAAYPRLAPGGRTRWHVDARHALELPPGTLERSGTRVGDTLHCAAAG